MKIGQIKLCPIFIKKAPFLFKKGAKMSKIDEKKQKITLLLFQCILRF